MLPEAEGSFFSTQYRPPNRQINIYSFHPAESFPSYFTFEIIFYARKKKTLLRMHYRGNNAATDQLMRIKHITITKEV